MVDVFLRIRSFVGYSPGASHFYGELVCPGAKLGEYRKSISHRLTKREAKELTKMHSSGYTYKEGYISQAFVTKDDIRVAAIAQYRELFPAATRLLEGDPVYPDEQKIILHTVKDGNDEN